MTFDIRLCPLSLMESCVDIRIIESTEDTGPRVCQVSRARQRGILREYLRWYLNDVSQVRPGKASAVQGFITVIPRHVSIRVGQFSRVLVDRLPVLRFERTAGKFTALDSNQTWSAACYWHGVYTLQPVVQPVVQPVGWTMQMSSAKRRLSGPARTLTTSIGWRAARRLCGQ